MLISEMPYVKMTYNKAYLKQLTRIISDIKYFNFLEKEIPKIGKPASFDNGISAVWYNCDLNIVIIILERYKDSKVFVEFMGIYNDVVSIKQHLSKIYGKGFNTYAPARKYVGKLIVSKQFLTQFEPAIKKVTCHNGEIPWKDIIIGLGIDHTKIFSKEIKNASTVSRDTEV